MLLPDLFNGTEKRMVMGMREKLIGLLVNLTDRLGCQLVGYSLATKIADRLISNGVTIPVRCKDCKHHEHCDALLYCGHSRGLAGSVSPDDFCSYGERRTDETD